MTTKVTERLQEAAKAAKTEAPTGYLFRLIVSEMGVLIRLYRVSDNARKEQIAAWIELEQAPINTVVQKIKYLASMVKGG